MRKRNIGKSAKIRLESDGWEDVSHRELTTQTFLEVNLRH